jgi:hypothetical protein
MAITGKGISRKLTAVGDKLEGTFKIDRITWISETSTDGDNLVLTDFQGDIVVETVADTTTYTETFYTEGLWVTDLTVTTMDTGYIIVMIC